MTEYPSREHANADAAAYRRLKTALTDLRDEASLYLRRLDGGSVTEVHASDAGRFESKVAMLRTSLSELAILSQVREWHAADQAEADLSETHVDAKPYAGQRRCLFNCPHQAKWDVGGFLSCDDGAHLLRARDALERRREQEDAHDEGVAAEFARTRHVTIRNSTGVQYGDGNEQTNVYAAMLRDYAGKVVAVKGAEVVASVASPADTGKLLDYLRDEAVEHDAVFSVPSGTDPQEASQ